MASRAEQSKQGKRESQDDIGQESRGQVMAGLRVTARSVDSIQIQWEADLCF